MSDHLVRYIRDIRAKLRDVDDMYCDHFRLRCDDPLLKDVRYTVEQLGESLDICFVLLDAIDDHVKGELKRMEEGQ